MKVLTDDSNYGSIADSIRAKLGVETTYRPGDMASAIDSIPVGEEIGPDDEGKVVVEDSGSYVLQAQTSRTISSNGTYDTTVNDEVTVDVSGGGIGPEDEGKVVVGGELVSQTTTTVTANGTYDTTTNDEVTVNVSGGGLVRLTADNVDFGGGYVANGTFQVVAGDTSLNDMYTVEGGEAYIVGLGSTVGNRFRVMFSTKKTYGASTNVQGVSIAYSSNPPAYFYSDSYVTPDDGYITIQKANNKDQTGIESYVYKVS